LVVSFLAAPPPGGPFLFHRPEGLRRCASKARPLTSRASAGGLPATPSLLGACGECRAGERAVGWAARLFSPMEKSGRRHNDKGCGGWRRPAGRRQPPCCRLCGIMATIDESARRQRPADSGYRPGVALTQPQPPQRGHSLSLRPWCIGTRPCGLALRAFCIQCVEGAPVSGSPVAAERRGGTAGRIPARRAACGKGGPAFRLRPRPRQSMDPNFGSGPAGTRRPPTPPGKAREGCPFAISRLCNGTH
jgi:hypothetical protein